MSDQVHSATADTRPTPNVVMAPNPEGGFVALVHMGDVIRTVFAETLARMKQKLTSAGISEFRMGQAQADSFAAQAVEKHEGVAGGVSSMQEVVAHHDTANEAVQAAANHIDLLHSQLTEAQQELAKVKEEAQARITAAEEEVEKWKAEATSLRNRPAIPPAPPMPLQVGDVASSSVQAGDPADATQQASTPRRRVNPAAASDVTNAQV